MQLTEAMAVELAPHHVQVNAIAPGWIATEMTAIARENPDFAEFNKMILARTPAARWGEADEIAGAAVFLVSPPISSLASPCQLMVGTRFVSRWRHSTRALASPRRLNRAPRADRLDPEAIFDHRRANRLRAADAPRVVRLESSKATPLRRVTLGLVFLRLQLQF